MIINNTLQKKPFRNICKEKKALKLNIVIYIKKKINNVII